MDTIFGGSVSDWGTLGIVLSLSLICTVIILFFLAGWLSEDEKNFWSEWHPFVDRKRRRIVLEATATGWIVLKGLPDETKNQLCRSYYAPWKPLRYLGIRKSVAVVVKTIPPFPCDVELWNEHFGKRKKQPPFSLLV